jgi:Mg-chelatase subunit ChlD
MWSDLLAARAAVVVEAPQRLWLLAIVVLVVAAGLLTAGRRGAALAAAARMMALSLLVLVAAGLSIEVPREARSLCLVLSTDVSASVGDRAERLGDEIARDLVAKLRPDDRLGAVAFARQAQILAWPSAPPRPPRLAAPLIDRSATRLASGIEAAIPLCPEDSERKLVLITDGNETAGDARRAAALARETDTRVYAELPGSNGHGEGVLLEKLVAPPLVREGSVFTMRAVVRNGFAESKRAALDFLVDGAPAAQEAIRLDPGVNVFEVPYQLHQRGSYRLAARLLPDGAESEERREATLAVAGPLRALVVTRAPDSAFARALRMREVDVEFREPAKFPKLEELLQYHCVVFDDVRRKELTREALDALESYVKTFGGGFLMTGGPGSFGDKDFQKSPIERVLPVHLVAQEPKAKGRLPMGMFLLIDRSNSMGYNSRRHDVRDGEKMRYARGAALAMVAQLRPEDRIGVIAFDSDPYVLGPLRPLSEQRSELEDRIARLVPGGGTDFKTALEIATAQLVQSGLKTLHVILLTDGDTNRGADDHVAVIQAMARLGISVTTIRIGDDEVNLEFLKRISRDTGGRFYHVEDIERLPELIVNDTRQARGEKEAADRPPEDTAATVAGPRRPIVGEATEVVRGLAEFGFPPVGAVPPTKVKAGADLVLYVGDAARKQPLLATWQYGLGRAAAFPFDPTQPDLASWAAWPGFAKLWSQLVRWAVREEASWETKQSVRFRDGLPYLEVQTFDDLGAGAIEAQLFTAPESPVALALTPVAPRLYRAPLPPLPPGKYALRLARPGTGGAVAQKRDVITVDAGADDAAGAETSRHEPDVELLREITAETGGSIGPSLDDLTARHGATRLERRRLDWLAIPLALALLFADMAIRLREERR